MTSFTFHFRASGKKTDSSGTLFIRIIHRRKYKDIRRDYRLAPDQWDPVSRTPVLPGPADPENHRRLAAIAEAMKADLRLLATVASELKEDPRCGVGEIAARFLAESGSGTVTGFARRLAVELLSCGRYRTARAYRSAARSLAAFAGKDLTLEEVRTGLLIEYEQWMRDNGLKMNTISFYMRNLRAMYYKAVKAGEIQPQKENPFSRVYTGVHETRRRALDREEMEALARLSSQLERRTAHRKDSEEEPEGAKTGDLRRSLLYFMFAYHSRGMSFIDLAYLRKSEIIGNTIRYKRKKTGFYMEVVVTPPMRKILRHFSRLTKNSPYVFPILSCEGPEARKNYETALSYQNKMLKILARRAGIGKRISTHVARHTWATMAKRLGYSVSLISEGLGHRDPKVTSIYLASFERSAMEEISKRLSNAISAA